MRQFFGGFCIALALGVFSLALVNTAWMSDDAYISFRVADNLLQGYGLRWNIDERVQTFTNPLWVLLNAAAASFNRESWHIYFSGLALSRG
jgi:arabinofuranosyltransferase